MNICIANRKTEWNKPRESVHNSLEASQIFIEFKFAIYGEIEQVGSSMRRDNHVEQKRSKISRNKSIFEIINHPLVDTFNHFLVVSFDGIGIVWLLRHLDSEELKNLESFFYWNNYWMIQILK